MKLGTTQTQPQTEDPRTWIGGEATVGSQVGWKFRRQNGRTKYLLSTVLGLTFLGGLALGGAVSRLCRTKAK